MSAVHAGETAAPVAPGAAHGDAAGAIEPSLPPVTQLGMASLALIVAGGIYLSSHLPRHVPLAPAVILLVLSAGLFAFNLYLLSRVRAFAWERFFAVARWSLLAYTIIGGLIEFSFLHNHVSGGPLVVLTLSIVVFVLHVPTLIGFTVARFATAGGLESQSPRP